jgi:hypothetical protein
MVTLVVPPIFNVLGVTPVKDGYEYRVWTNTKSVVIRGREYRFSKVGETTLKVDSGIDDIDMQLDRDRSQGFAWRSTVGASTATDTGVGRVPSHPDDHGRLPTFQNMPMGNQIGIHTVTMTY